MSTSFLSRVLGAALLLSLSWIAQGAVNLGDKLPLNPQVRIGKLENGLTYYVQHNSRPEKRVELRLVVTAGSVLEDDDQQGLAHFAEHMAFDGSRHFKKHELISYLQSIGVKFGADLNAYTSFDETVYILPIPTDKQGNLETGMLVLEDWAQGVEMTDDAIEQERPVVLEELRLGKGANDRMNRVLLPEVYNGSRYAERLPIGKEELLKSFPHEAVRRFYADWYRPDLMAVVVVGDVDPDAAEKMIRDHFAKLANPTHERPRDYAKIPARAKSNALVITDKEAVNNVVLIRYPVFEVPPVATIGEYRQEIVKALYTDMLALRLQELTQQSNPPFLAATSALAQIAAGYESFSSTVVIGRAGVGPAIQAVVQESERARQLGFNADELEREKKVTLRSYENMYNEREKSESSVYAAEYIRNFLTREPIPGIAAEFGYASELLPGISIDEVNRYARQVTPSKTRALVAYLGSSKESETIPEKGQLLATLEAAEKNPVTAARENAVSAQLMAEPPKPGSIISESPNLELGTIEMTLSNGVKVVLKPSDFKNDQVLMSVARFGGQSVFDDRDMFSARYASAVASSMGLGKFPPIEIPKILAGKTASLQTNSSMYIDSITGAAGSDDLESLFQLLFLRMTSPRKDEDLFKAFVQKAQDAAKNAASRPESVFSDTVQGLVYAEHPRLARLAKPEDFDRIDLERAMSIFKQTFGSAKGLTFIIVGSFDPAKIRPLVATYLASLPNGDVAPNFRDIGIRTATGIVKKEVRVGTEPKSRVSLTFTGPATYSREEKARFLLLIDAMNIKITDILREKMSLIYGGGMSGSFNRIPDVNYAISVNLPCSPENVDKVIGATFAEIEKVKSEGPLQSDLDKAKQHWIEEHRIAMRTNEYWLAYLQDSILYNNDPEGILTVENRVLPITAEELKKAAVRYFNRDNYVQAIMFPSH